MKYSLVDALQLSSQKVEAELAQSIESHIAPELREPVSHAVLSGGKRLRAFMVLQSCLIHGVDEDAALKAGAAIEAMHAYSLVHDDLPAMDDDDLRRGQPTVHVKWDEATAILTGDALQCLSFEILSEINAEPKNVLKLIKAMASASGAKGMVLGQALDIAAETTSDPLDVDAIIELQANKTGALFEWSATAGAILGHEDISPMKNYAKSIGLAFQIKDDILDVEGDAKLAGKRLQKDNEAGKATFVTLMGLDGAKEAAQTYVKKAENALDGFGTSAIGLRQLAQFIITRKM